MIVFMGLSKIWVNGQICNFSFDLYDRHFSIFTGGILINNLISYDGSPKGPDNGHQQGHRQRAGQAFFILEPQYPNIRDQSRAIGSCL